MPSVELPDYQKIAQSEKSGKKKEIEVDEKELMQSLEWLQKSRAKYLTVLRPAQKGDRVEIDFVAKKDGQAFDGGESKNHPVILGEGKFVPGFEDNLIGLKENEEKKFSLVFPEDFPKKELAGQPVDFEAKMNLVQEAQIPELNDEFAKTLGAFADLAALKTNIKEGLAMEKEQRAKEAARAKILESIVKKTKMDVPRLLVEAETEKMLQEFKGNIAQMGLEMEAYLKNIKKTEAELRQEWQTKAGERVRAALVLRQIADIEKIEVSEKEIQDDINKILANYPDIDSIKNQIDMEQLKEYTRGRLRNEKVFEKLESF
jgi:trigger factor